MNEHCHNKHVSNDTTYFDTPNIYDSFTCIQLFVGTKSLVLYLYGMKTDNQFVNTSEDNIRERVAISKFISNCAQYEVRNYSQSIH